MSEDFAICKLCGCSMTIPDGLDRTDYCHDCAHSRCEELEHALERIANHDGTDINGCGMDLNELLQAMRDIAEAALEREPKETK